MSLETKPLSISELTRRIKSLVEGEFPEVWITGEISNFHHHGSGHMYFTLKDRQSEIRCIFFKGFNQYLRFKPEEGMQIIASGPISLYEKRGQYQLSVRHMEPAGVGTLYLAFEALKKKLQLEGLFEGVHKQPIPKYPKKVGLITSGSGAALQDMIQVLGRRAPHIALIVHPTKVQGLGAAEDIVAGIQTLQEIQDIDVIIAGRGGGSLEDLWAFNEEKVARAIFSCPIPIISAVGHEVDIAISDLVADLRAPTPSAAAELVSVTTQDIVDYGFQLVQTIETKVRDQLNQQWQECDGFENRLMMQNPSNRIQRKQESLHKISHQMEFAVQSTISTLKSQIEGIENHLHSLNPMAILDRGFSIVTSKEGDIIRSNEDIQSGELFDVRTGDGQFEAEKKGSLEPSQLS